MQPIYSQEFTRINEGCPLDDDNSVIEEVTNNEQESKKDQQDNIEIHVVHENREVQVQAVQNTITNEQVSPNVAIKTEEPKECHYQQIKEVSPRPTSMGSIFKSSEVFKLLRDEKILNREAKEEARKKLTTFLQKPNRPVPKSKEDLELEHRIPYKVNIIKQPKPRCDPNRVPTPPPSIQPNTFPLTKQESRQNEISNTVATKREPVFEPVRSQPILEPVRKPVCEPIHKPLQEPIQPIESAVVCPVSQTPIYRPLQVSIPTTKDTTIYENVPVLTPIQNGKSTEIQNGVKNSKNILNCNGKADSCCFNGGRETLKKSPIGVATPNKPELDDESTNPEAIRLALEQLTDVQKQLLTLSSMRSTIQTTLGSIAIQIEKLMFALREKNDLGVIVE